MADWRTTTIEFASELPAEDVSRLNASLLILDYDTPAFGPRGLMEARWRSPMMGLREIVNWCHVLTGVPCFGRMWADSSYIEDEWLYGSNEDATSQPEMPECGDFDLSEIRKVWGDDFRGDRDVACQKPH